MNLLVSIEHDKDTHIITSSSEMEEHGRAIQIGEPPLPPRLFCAGTYLVVPKYHITIKDAIRQGYLAGGHGGSLNYRSTLILL